MSITTSEMTPADIAAVTGNRNNCDDGMFGGNGAWWIILFLIFAIFGWGGNGFGNGYGNNGGGAAENYVLASDFATLQRQLSDGFNSQERKLDSISNGICSLGYDQLAQINGVNQNVSNLGFNLMNGMTTNGYETRIAINGLGTQLADCCCNIREGIQANTTQGIMNTANLTSQIKDCCCENEKIAMQNRFDMAQYNCSTLQAIDKVGDRIIDYLAADKAQALRDENQALRLAASQTAQNNYLVSQLKAPCPIPAYTVPNPNCCYGAFNGSCGA